MAKTWVQIRVSDKTKARAEAMRDMMVKAYQDGNPVYADLPINPDPTGRYPSELSLDAFLNVLMDRVHAKRKRAAKSRAGRKAAKNPPKSSGAEGGLSCTQGGPPASAAG
jgi:hypothetical protein